MKLLNSATAAKLQKIFSKRVGRELSTIELEEAYENLMGFAEALMELSEPEIENIPNPTIKIQKKSELPIAKEKESKLQYV